MNVDVLIERVKDECKGAVKLLKVHAKNTKPEENNVDSMKFFRNTAQGKVSGMISITIIMCAKEFVNDENSYWERVKDIREYEEETKNEIADIFNDWYLDCLNNSK